MINKHYSFLFQVIFMLTLPFGTILSQTTVVVSPSYTFVENIGDSLVVEIIVQNVENLHIMQDTIKYDPSYLRSISIDEGPFLGSGGNSTFFYPEVDSVNGKILTDHSILGPECISGSGTHMKLRFQALQGGSTSIVVSYVRMRDGNNEDILPIHLQNGLVQIGTSGILHEDLDVMLPDKIRLFQNYPNPFNPVTNICFELAREGPIVFKIFNLKGRDIITLIDEYYKAGHYQITWDGRDKYGRSVANGVYIFYIQSGQYHISKKGMLMR